MSNADFTTLPNKSTTTTTNNSEITKNEKIILGFLLLLMSILLVVIGQELLQRRFPIGHNSIMVSSDRYQGIFGTTSMQYIFSLELYKKTDIKLFGDFVKSAELSPDGQWIMFSRMESSGGFSKDRIYIMRVDGTQQTLVPVLDGGKDPTWSPDGKQIAFYGYGSKLAGIYIANIECLLRGESCVPTPRLLVEQPARYTIASPDWSPDGRKIAYSSVKHISVINVNGQSQPVELPPNFSGRSAQPQWSPDGTKIVGLCSGDFSGYSVCVMNSDGTNLVYLTQDSRKQYPYHPKWSPDGQMIAFISTFSNKEIPQSCWPDGCSSVILPTSVFIMNADGSRLTHLPLENDIVIRWFYWNS